MPRGNPFTAPALLGGFDEAEYLACNPDVVSAVANGDFDSGLEHAVLFGIIEGRKGLSDELGNLPSLIVGTPQPPSHLRLRVHGDEEAEQFGFVGKVVAKTIQTAIDALPIESESMEVLDFGCGCGRVLAPLSQMSPAHRYSGTDIDAEAIGWCQENLSELANFDTNDDRPPSRYEADSFDLAYSISVFTHLPEDMQFEWLAELARVVRPGGYLLLTVHGDKVSDGPAKKRRKLNKHGIYYSVSTSTDGLPDYYQTTYHTTDYIRSRWNEYFEIVDVVVSGVMAHHDLVVGRVR